MPRPAAAKLRHVVYLVESALSPRNRDRFGVAWMAAQGVAVSVVDVGPLTLPELGGDRRLYADYRDFSVTVVKTTDDIKKAIPTLAAADLIVSLVGTNHFAPRNIAVCRAIAQAGTPYMILSLNAYPGWTRETQGAESASGRLRRLAQRIGSFDPAKSISARLPLRWLGIPAARFAVYGGAKSRVANRFVDASTISIAAHSMDCEAFRPLRAAPPAATDTAVFIDEYRPYHPDLKEMGRTYSAAEAAYYFERMRAVFDRVERELGLTVVIAAMPKADYNDKPGVYGARRIEYGKTAELVAASRLVLAHRSTAIGFAVMADKPVLQIATRDIYRELIQKPYFDAYAVALGKPIQFCDDAAEVDLSLAFARDEARYAAFLRDYVSEAPTDLPFWQIVVEKVEERL
jgi:hypothetical protein